MSSDRVRQYRICLCDRCVAGEGGICWTPGCALWAKAAPDVPLKPEPHYVIELMEVPHAERAEMAQEAHRACYWAHTGLACGNCDAIEVALRRVAARVWREAARIVAEEGVIPTVSGVDNVIADALATRLRKCAAEVERDG